MDKYILLLVLAAFLIVAALVKVPMNPKYDEVRTDRKVEFKVFGLAENLKVDDNPEFVSPIEKGRPFFLDLDPGTYYWKADNSFLIGKFTIQSEVGINLEKLEEKYRVHNVGNTDLDLEIGKNGILTGAAVLGLEGGVDLQPENNLTIIAKQRG